MQLAICIPTHNGRAETLRTLLESIVFQEGISPLDSVEICVSDNASQDGTAALIANVASISPFPIAYFRFDTDQRGVRNFINVVEMASAEYCWLIGSDDALLPGAIARAFAALHAHPGIRGMTAQKINFDRSLSVFDGPDHEVILPPRSSTSRWIAPAELAVDELAFTFAYMSAHIFRRDAWREIVARHGVGYLTTLRHFPHAFVFAEIAKAQDGWLWLADYLVVQRLDNFCVLDAVEGRPHQYAIELTEDLVAVYTVLLGRCSARIMRGLFLVYWNPLQVLRYRAAGGRGLTVRCFQWFRKVPLFWATAMPALLLPLVLARPAGRAIEARGRARVESDVHLRDKRHWFFHALLRMLGIEGVEAGRLDTARLAAREFSAWSEAIQAHEKRY